MRLKSEWFEGADFEQWFDERFDALLSEYEDGELREVCTEEDMKAFRAWALKEYEAELDEIPDYPEVDR